MNKVPRFRAKRMSDGEYVEGSLIMREAWCFTYILTDENHNRMVVDDVTGDCSCKLVRVLEHSVEQIS